MNKKRVMYISHDTGEGGSARSLIDMLLGLKNDIVPIVIIPRKGLIESYLKELDIQYQIVPFSLNYGKIGMQTEEQNNKIFLENYLAAKKIIKIVEEKDIQIIHSNSIVISVGAMVSAMINIPHVWHIREFLEEDFNCQIYDRVLYDKLFEVTDQFISISKIIKQAYEEKYRIFSTQIYDGIDVESYCTDIMLMKEEKNSFLLAGGIHEGKGQWEAIYAVEYLINEGEKDIHLYIVGTGDKRYIWCMKHYIEQRGLVPYITIMSFQKNLRELRKKCKYSITSSKMEALGRVTIEALLAGNIVIGANTGGTLEIIGKSQERGYLYEQGSYQDLARVMKSVKESKKEETDKYRIANEIKEIFNTEKYANSVLKLYQNIFDTDEILTSKNKLIVKDYLTERYLECEKNSKSFENLNIDNCGIIQRRKVLMEKWNQIRQSGRSFTELLTEWNINTIAIYGMGIWGCDLYDEIKKTEIKISYVMDQNKNYLDRVVKVFNIEEDIPYVDAIIVTVLAEENSLKEKLQVKGDFKILLLSDLITQMANNNEKHVSRKG